MRVKMGNSEGYAATSLLSAVAITSGMLLSRRLGRPRRDRQRPALVIGGAALAVLAAVVEGAPSLLDSALRAITTTPRHRERRSRSACRPIPPLSHAIPHRVGFDPCQSRRCRREPLFTASIARISRHIRSDLDGY
jgi:hypothetical protein